MMALPEFAERVSDRLAMRLGGSKFTRERFPDGIERDVFMLPRPDG